MTMVGTIRDLRQKFDASSILMKIIWINISLFVLLRLAAIVMIFSGHSDEIESMLALVEMPSNLSMLARRPWTVISYMFSQYDVLHIVFNMLWFYWFGQVFLLLATSRQTFALYIYGGLGGAALFLLSYNIFPVFSHHTSLLIGSSASVIAIVTATALLMPDYKFNLLFIGFISLKWVAIATIGLDLIGVTGANAGGHIAHLGGAAVGAWYGLAMKRGTDITRPLNSLLDSIVNSWRRVTSFKFKPVQKTVYTPPPPHSGNRSAGRSSSRPHTNPDDQAILDTILDKIKKSGYTSLTPEERRRLFDVSNRIS